MSKHDIRQELLARRKQLDVATCVRLSRQVQQQLIAADCFQRAQVMALYSPINNEVQTDQLYAAAVASGKIVCFPRTVEQGLDFRRVTSLSALTVGRFGVAEPVTGESCSLADMDMIVVPGVAFDRSGHRLGYGKGFYDRELASTAERTKAVGLCFAFQLCMCLPREVHDRPVQFLATQTEFIHCYEKVAVSP